MTRADTWYADARFRADDARAKARRFPTQAILDLANGLEVLVQAILTERRDATPGEGAAPTGETSEPTPPSSYVLMCGESYCGRLFEWKGESSSHDDALRQAVAAARAAGWEVESTHGGGVKATCQGEGTRLTSAYDDGVQAERERILKVIAAERANAVLRSVERGIRGELWFWNEGPGADKKAFKDAMDHTDQQIAAASGVTYVHRADFTRPDSGPVCGAGEYAGHEGPCRPRLPGMSLSGHGWYGPTDPVRREQAYQEALAAQRARIQAEADACGDTFVTIKDGKITPLEDPKPPVGGDWNLLTGRDALAALNITPNTDDGPNGARLYRDEPTWLRRVLMWLAGR